MRLGLISCLLAVGLSVAACATSQVAGTESCPVPVDPTSWLHRQVTFPDMNPHCKPAVDNAGNRGTVFEAMGRTNYNTTPYSPIGNPDPLLAFGLGHMDKPGIRPDFQDHSEFQGLNYRALGTLPVTFGGVSRDAQAFVLDTANPTLSSVCIQVDGQRADGIWAYAFVCRSAYRQTSEEPYFKMAKEAVSKDFPYLRP